MKLKRYRVYLALSLLVAFGGLGAAIGTGAQPRLGLDLEGGVSVILTATGEGADDPKVLDQTVEIIRNRIDEIGVAESEVTRAGETNILVQMPGVKNEEQAVEVIGSTAQLTFRQVEAMYQKGAKNAPPITEEEGPAANEQTVVYPSAQPGEEGVLYELQPAVLEGDVVTKAEAIIVDPTAGNDWVVTIDMNETGSEQWANFTSDMACLRDEGEQVKSQVAIVLDGRVESAAGMEAPGQSAGGGVECGTGIAGGQTSIDVATEEEAKTLALVLRTGALPVTLEQSQVQKVSPTLGRDSLNAGLLAGALGMGLVFIYVLLYYRALALVVWGGLLVFAACLYTLLAFLGEGAGLALSLAGIAGVIVSIGVTADSYIVAFERLKDEAHAGKS
ncbi:MAG: protein translocase subunit SecD, partial [Actinobacteria bacterium]|nr:protein translocase subunit SecD [Actinomycetota bacterium]